MDARLDTLSDELCQVTTCVGRIARRQARISGFATFLTPSPSLKASEDEDTVDGNDDQDEDASSSNDEEMTASQ